MTGSHVAALIDAHAAGLVLFARAYCRTPEDVVMATFAKLAGLRTSPDDCAAWLFRVVKHAAIDVGKAEARRRRREQLVAKPERWFAAECDDAERAVEALQSLPGDVREVVVMRLWGGLTLTQIAAALGCSVSSAHRRYESAIHELRVQLGEVRHES